MYDITLLRDWVGNGFICVSEALFFFFFFFLIGTAIQYRLNGVLCIYTCYAKRSFSTGDIFTN